MPAAKPAVKNIVANADGSVEIHYVDGLIHRIEPKDVQGIQNQPTRRARPLLEDPDDIWEPPQPRRVMRDYSVETGGTMERRIETRVEKRGIGCLPAALLALLMSIILIGLTILLFPQLQKFLWALDIVNKPAASCSNPYAPGWDGEGNGDYIANGQIASEGLIWVYLEKNSAGDNIGLGKVVKTLPSHGAGIHVWLGEEECGPSIAKDVKGVDMQ